MISSNKIAVCINDEKNIKEFNLVNSRHIYTNFDWFCIVNAL